MGFVCSRCTRLDHFFPGLAPCLVGWPEWRTDTGLMCLWIPVLAQHYGAEVVVMLKSPYATGCVGERVLRPAHCQVQAIATNAAQTGHVRLVLLL